MTTRQLLMLLLLSVLWGGSFLFIGIAVLAVHPLYVVFLRVGIAALIMLPVLYFMRIGLPTGIRGWFPFFGMGLLNNVIPFSCIFYAQTEISVSLAAIVNATTPIFTFAILAIVGVEKLVKNKLIGSLVGVTGVAVLLDISHLELDGTSKGILLSLGAALSYGTSALWSKYFLTGIKPLQSATCQLVASTTMLSLILLLMQPAIPTKMLSLSVVMAILALAALSTALAYAIFFQLISEAGVSNTMLVTLLVPVSGALLGWAVMNDQLALNQLFGAAIIAFALVIIDGRAWLWFRRH